MDLNISVSFKIKKTQTVPKFSLYYFIQYQNDFPRVQNEHGLPIYYLNHFDKVSLKFLCKMYLRTFFSFLIFL